MEKYKVGSQRPGKEHDCELARHWGRRKLVAENVLESGQIFVMYLESKHLLGRLIWDMTKRGILNGVEDKLCAVQMPCQY